MRIPYAAFVDSQPLEQEGAQTLGVKRLGDVFIHPGGQASVPVFFDRLASQLQQEGTQAFTHSWAALLALIDTKCKLVASRTREETP